MNATAHAPRMDLPEDLDEAAAATVGKDVLLTAGSKMGAMIEATDTPAVVRMSLQPSP